MWEKVLYNSEITLTITILDGYWIIHHKSYGTSYTNLPTTVMRFIDFKQVQFCSLFLSTFVSHRKRGSAKIQTIFLLRHDVLTHGARLTSWIVFNKKNYWLSGVGLNGHFMSSGTCGAACKIDFFFNFFLRISNYWIKYAQYLNLQILNGYSIQNKVWERA